jgi:hypothetical protein
VAGESGVAAFAVETHLICVLPNSGVWRYSTSFIRAVAAPRGLLHPLALSRSSYADAIVDGRPALQPI